MSRVRALLCSLAMVACVPRTVDVAEPSQHGPLAEACACGVGAARDRLAAALRMVKARSEIAPAMQCDDCVARVVGLSGVPAPKPEPTQHEGDTIESLIRGIRGLDAPELFVDRDGWDPPVCGLSSYDGRVRELVIRHDAFVSAWREALLASSICHGLAVVVALDAELVGSERARARERGVVLAASEHGRQADTFAAMAVGLLAAFDASIVPRGDVRLVGSLAAALEDATVEGGFESDAELAWGMARKHAADPELSAWHTAHGRALRGSQLLPVTGAPAPTLKELLESRGTQPALAAIEGVEGLWRRDLGAVARGASPLHGRRAAPTLELAGADRLVAGDSRAALGQAIELVPFYTDAGKALGELEKRLRGKKR
jgi:hypothetical protein